MSFLKLSILKDLKLYYKENYECNNLFIYSLIKSLGGTICQNKEEADIILLNNNQFIISDKENQRILNIRWIFDCYFYFVEMSEK